MEYLHTHNNNMGKYSPTLTHNSNARSSIQKRNKIVLSITEAHNNESFLLRAINTRRPSALMFSSTNRRWPYYFLCMEYYISYIQQWGLGKSVFQQHELFFGSFACVRVFLLLFFFLFLSFSSLLCVDMGLINHTWQHIVHLYFRLHCVRPHWAKSVPST